MAENNITPEEKLLRIIENSQVSKRKVALERGKGGRGRIKDITERLKRLHIDKEKFKHIDLAVFNKAMLIVCVAITLFLFFDFIRVRAHLDRRFEKILKEALALDVRSEEVSFSSSDINDTMALAGKRNIFSFIPVAPVVMEDPNALNVSDIVASLKVVGILWSDNPQVMIEDTRDQRTYFLNTGEQIGELKVKSIFKDKVIISKDDQVWELR